MFARPYTFIHRSRRQNDPIYKSIANLRRPRIYMSMEGLSLICGRRICGGVGRRGVNSQRINRG